MSKNEEIVISGIAGRLPESENLEEFLTSLLNGSDLVTENDRRFKPGYKGLPKRSGTISEADKFDNMFFGIPHIQAEEMDPTNRILLECAYECIVDAGINPTELRGSKTGVYIGSSSCQPVKSNDLDNGTSAGVLVALAANRISYVFDFKGPSYVCDTVCSTSFYCLVNAFNDLLHGEIDNAIVASANLLFQPSETLAFQRMAFLSPEGHCKTFSSERNGYVRSEAVVSLLLQKKKDCRRIYATVAGGKLNADGYKKEGFTHPCSEAQYEIMKNLYNEFDININDISYFETHGTGTVVGDDSECRAIAKMFQKKTEPLLIGSVKSNMGHSELCAGLCSILKVISIFQTGVIPANLHFDPLDKKLPGISEGKLKVVTANMKFHNGLVGLNCFGVGGANGHIVLKPHIEPKRIQEKTNNELVLVSGRTPEAVDFFLDGVLKYQHDLEFLAMVNEIHKSNISGHNFRGYMVMGNEKLRGIDRFVCSRPICFVYSGLGCQWRTMGRNLLKIDLFRKTFDRCADALKPYGKDLHYLVTTDDISALEDISNCFVAINAIQIALTDVLTALEIKPDYFLGHSLGEQACSYANGGMTPEEAVLLSYARGFGFSKTKKTISRGQMAAVGLSKEEITAILPEGVYLACHNSSQLVTISGLQSVTESFVKDLQSQGVFAKTVESCGEALHTKYIKDAACFSYEFFKKCLTHPRPRSKKWISTSIPEDHEKSHWANYNSAEYHFNNMCNVVLFHQALKQIPENAIVIEIGPHGFLQPILKRELGTDSTIIPLLNKGAADNEQFFSSAIGKIYAAGGQPQLSNYNRTVNFPVSKSTTMISPFVKWDHRMSWPIPRVEPKKSFDGCVTLNLSNPHYSHLLENRVDENIIMPGMTYLVMVWRVVAEEFFFRNYEEVPLVTENLAFKRMTTLSVTEDNKFDLNITGTGYFEIYESGSLVVSGNVRGFETLPEEFANVRDPVTLNRDSLILKRLDFYKHFHLRGQIFGDKYRKVVSSNIDATCANVEWSGKWDCLLENILQLTTFFPDSKHLVLTSFIERIVIDPQILLRLKTKQKEIGVVFDPQLNITRCEGIRFWGLEAAEIPRKVIRPKPILETQEFIYFEDVLQKFSLAETLCISLQIALQNSFGVIKRPKICFVSSERQDGGILPLVKDIMARQPLTDPEYYQNALNEMRDKYDIVIFDEFVINDSDRLNLEDYVAKDGFFIYIGSYDNIEKYNLNIIFKSETSSCNICLLRLNHEFSTNCNYVKVCSSNFHWLELLQTVLQRDPEKMIYLYSEEEQISGLLGLIRTLCTEEDNFRAILIEDYHRNFDFENIFFTTQLAKNLTINVLRNGKWGTYVHFPFKQKEVIEVTDASVMIDRFGDISSLGWVQLPAHENRKYDSNQEVQVFFSGLCLRDVWYVTEKHNVKGPPSPTEKSFFFGHEYSGISHSRRLMGLVKYGGISLQVESVPHFTWEVPPDWNLRAAATVPMAYALSYYALKLKCHLVENDSILVHPGIAPASIAAISIALSMGCKVYVTISNESEQKVLEEIFPALENKLIDFSSEGLLEKTIMTNTNFKGVNIIFNSSDGNLSRSLQCSLVRCLAENGHYIELEKTVSLSKFPVGLNNSSKSYSFHGLSLDQLLNGPTEVKELIDSLFRDGLRNEVIKPLPNIVFQETDVCQAFRYLDSKKYKTKVLIQLREEESNNVLNLKRTILAAPKLYFNPKKSYVIVGGTGGFGLELTSWMISRGATKIILNSRREITNGYQFLCQHRWSKNSNVCVKVYTDDTTSSSGAEELIKKSQTLGPVGGIFHMTLVLRDNTIRNQTVDDFEVVFKSKLLSLRNLDDLSRKLCSNLDHFVVFSSLSTGRGVGGQTNYGMANAAMERLCEKRRNDSLPALAIQWGPVGDVGAYQSFELISIMKNYLSPQPIETCLESLEIFMLQSKPVGASVIIQEITEDESSKTQTAAGAVGLILGIKDIDSVDKSLTMVQLGMDSLMAAEIRQTLYRNFKMELNLEKIRNLTLSNLSGIKK